MSTFGWYTSTSTSSTIDYSYGYTIRRPQKKYRAVQGDGRRPFAHLKIKEEALKIEEDEPSGMPKEQILFDPKELVLGGKNK